MTKTWYNKTTGGGAVFDDAEDMSNWPDFQETQPDMTPILAAEARTQRDELLAASDSNVWPDHVPDAWRTYRQSLRDIPAQAGFPTDVTWPIEPS
tara:strand:- start:58 stop:342 length:285 start_codon:yes stop_codon:yes gene_type:complete